MPAGDREWGGSLHQTFRMIPPTPGLRVFLESDGLTKDEVLARLPYDAARGGTSGRTAPDPKRYRDGRHVYQTAGLLYEDDDARVRLTEFGRATGRWLDCLTATNSPVLGRHAAYALAACQLRNASRPGRAYAEDVVVFPFAFIWRAMLALDGRINSDELNRVMFRVTDEDGLAAAIARIAAARVSRDVQELGPETITGRARNDRVIPWVCLASFGWLLIADKRETGSEWYQIRPTCESLLREASQAHRKHREFSSTEAYVAHISNAASLPMDVR